MPSSPLPADAAPDKRAQVMARAAEIRDNVSNCADMRDVSATITSPEKGDRKAVKLSSLPVEIRKSVAVLEKDETSEPIPVEKGIFLVTICDRNDDDAGLPSRQEIRQRLGDRRLNMLVQRYMRELRRTAFVDVRV